MQPATTRSMVNRKYPFVPTSCRQRCSKIGLVISPRSSWISESIRSMLRSSPVGSASSRTGSTARSTACAIIRRSVYTSSWHSVVLRSRRSYSSSYSR